MTLFFQQKTPEPAQAKCLLRAVHLIRVHQSGLKGRAVPHFPEDLQDEGLRCVKLEGLTGVNDPWRF